MAKESPLSKHKERKGRQAREREALKERLRLAFEEYGKSQGEFAREVLGEGESGRQALNRWLSAASERMPALDDYVRLANGTGASLDWLLGRIPQADVGKAAGGIWRALYAELFDKLLLDAERRRLYAGAVHGSGPRHSESLAWAAFAKALRPPAIYRMAREQFFQEYHRGLALEHREEVSKLRRKDGRPASQLRLSRDRRKGGSRAA